jgi:hypothetical protein
LHLLTGAGTSNTDGETFCVAFASWSAEASLISPFLDFPALLGCKTSFDLYAYNLFTFTAYVSAFLLCLLWSTAIPTDWAHCGVSPASFNSAREKPLPSLTLAAYLRVYPLTSGLNFPNGLGNKAAALADLAYNLIFLWAVLLK